MSDERSGWLASRWGAMSSGPKMLFVLSLGLLPLGIIAIFASIYSARENSAQRAEQTLGRLEDKAERLNELLARSMGTMRAASAAVAAAPPDSPICERVLARLAGLQMEPGRYALYGPDGTSALRHAGLRAATWYAAHFFGPGAGDKPRRHYAATYPVYRTAHGRGDRGI